MANYNAIILLNKLHQDEKSARRLILKCVMACMADNNGRLALDIQKIADNSPSYRIQSVADAISDMVNNGEICLSVEGGSQFIYLMFMRSLNVAVTPPQSTVTADVAVAGSVAASAASKATTAKPAPRDPFAMPLPGPSDQPPDESGVSLFDAILWARWLARKLAISIKSSYARHGITVPKTFLDSDQKRRKWVNELKLMIVSDGISPLKVSKLIEFVERDSFWSKNILSPEKLRQHGVRLQMQLSKASPAKSNGISKFRQMADEIAGIEYDYGEE